MTEPTDLELIRALKQLRSPPPAKDFEAQLMTRLMAAGAPPVVSVAPGGRRWRPGKGIVILAAVVFPIAAAAAVGGTPWSRPLIATEVRPDAPLRAVGSKALHTIARVSERLALLGETSRDAERRDDVDESVGSEESSAPPEDGKPSGALGASALARQGAGAQVPMKLRAARRDVQSPAQSKASASSLQQNVEVAAVDRDVSPAGKVARVSIDATASSHRSSSPTGGPQYSAQAAEAVRRQARSVSANSPNALERKVESDGAQRAVKQQQREQRAAGREASQQRRQRGSGAQR